MGLVASVTALAQAVAADIKSLITSVSGKAANGANSDITSLSALTTALSVAQGGTGGTSQLLAQLALGLVKQTGVTDATAGSLLSVGAFGLGGAAVTVNAQDCNTLAKTEFLYLTSPTNGPGGDGWMLNEWKSATYMTQSFVSNTTGKQYTRTCINGAWTVWSEVLVAGSYDVGHIDGLTPVWNSSTSISVTSGSAYIPGGIGGGLGCNLLVPSTLTLSGISGLTASTWYYLYLNGSLGSTTIQLSTTAPSAPYSGTARTKAGDTTSRFICALYVNAAGGVTPFQWDSSGYINFLDSLGVTPFRVVSALAATMETIVSCAAIVPPTTQSARATLTNASTAAVGYIGYAAIPGCMLLQVATTSRFNATIPLDSTRRTSLRNSVTGGNFYMDITGYGSDR